jgi:hypothetical protein
MQGFSLLQGLTMTPESAWQDLCFAKAKLEKKRKKKKAVSIRKEKT